MDPTYPMTSNHCHGYAWKRVDKIN